MGLHVLTAGTFDILHQDHISLFEWCRKLATMYGKVTVAVNGDDFVGRFKGHQPVMDLDERMAVISSVKHVDTVVVNNGEDCLLPVIDRFVTSPNPVDVLVIGSDWYGRDYLDQIGADWLDLYVRNVGVTFVPSPNRVHSSDIKERMRIL